MIQTEGRTIKDNVIHIEADIQRTYSRYISDKILNILIGTDYEVKYGNEKAIV